MARFVLYWSCGPKTWLKWGITRLKSNCVNGSHFVKGRNQNLVIKMRIWKHGHYSENLCKIRPQLCTLLFKLIIVTPKMIIPTSFKYGLLKRVKHAVIFNKAYKLSVDTWLRGSRLGPWRVAIQVSCTTNRFIWSWWNMTEMCPGDTAFP